MQHNNTQSVSNLEAALNELRGAGWDVNGTSPTDGWAHPHNIDHAEIALIIEEDPETGEVSSRLAHTSDGGEVQWLGVAPAAAWGSDYVGPGDAGSLRWGAESPTALASFIRRAEERITST